MPGVEGGHSRTRESEYKATFHPLGDSSWHQPWRSLEASPSPHPGDAKFSFPLPFFHVLPLTFLFPYLLPVGLPLWGTEGNAEELSSASGAVARWTPHSGSKGWEKKILEHAMGAPEISSFPWRVDNILGVPCVWLGIGSGLIITAKTSLLFFRKMPWGGFNGIWKLRQASFLKHSEVNMLWVMYSAEAS